MGICTWIAGSRWAGVGLAFATPGLLGGCAPLPAVTKLLERPAARAGVPRYQFFGHPRGGDPWSVAIGDWRIRDRAALRTGRIPPLPALPAVAAQPPARTRAAGGYALAHRYDAFLAEQRRELAREVVRWVQDVSRERFRADGPIDHWPTLTELLGSVGDDCDGLELLAYHALRQLGFPTEQVYRAVVKHPETGRHHMVTLWFEDSQDPWLLDPTGTITPHLRRLSELPSWVPLKLFSEDAEFTVSRLDADPQARKPEPQAPEPGTFPATPRSE